ncbi:Stk1 family PASTA domain-containing Ser/Thr kinase [Pseudoclavibacter endophyticus]|nr:Stk1 family PASTA domain-containing Ser/Thr kinase [Pseudoclavibacter endophyticus]
MIGRLIDGRYQIRSLIARGGMATVYVATDLRLERRVAIKIMHDHLAADDNFRARFIREARAAAKLQHPNVVNVYDQGEDQSFAYIVMEYVPGITLRDLLHDHHRLTSEQAIDVMDAVLSGLQAAHRVGIVHRDLKPENVLLADDGRIKLSDFGLARAASANTASGQVLLGTIAYLSPELVTKGTAGIRSDIYSLGIMMYEMLTGEQPYRGDQPVNIAYRHANEDVPPPSDVQPDVPGELDDLVAWATERDPDERPADAGAMLAALRQAESDLSGRPGSTPSTVAGVPIGNESRDPIIASGESVNWDDWRDGEPTDPSTQVLVATDTSEDNDSQALWAGLVQRDGGDLVAVDDAAHGEPAEPQTRTRARRRWLAASIVIVLVLALVGGGAGWYFLAGPGSYEATPDVKGQSLEEAQANIEALGFAVGEVAEEPSLETPEGQVMRMSPDAGVNAAPGTLIDLVVSSGPAVIEVPDVVGLTETQAQFAIEQAGFTYDENTTIYQFSDVKAGDVLAATDGQGGPLPAEMAEQQPIRLVVSAGIVPDVVGYGQGSAIQQLEDVGLKGEVAANQYSDNVPAGNVVAATATTDPVRPGDTINLTVSLGPEPIVQVPDVVGMTVSQAVSALEAAGFKADHKVAPPLVGIAVVTAQTPGANTEVPESDVANTTVQLTVR